MHRDELRKQFTMLLNTVEHGCGNHGCILRTKEEEKGGQHTNAGCHCEWNIKKTLRYLLNTLNRERIERMQ